LASVVEPELAAGMGAIGVYPPSLRLDDVICAAQKARFTMDCQDLASVVAGRVADIVIDARPSPDTCPDAG
tara:strand:+ start:235 stop:447 length:213 start_codon:yes stop_codon:yes gene_type:complete